MARRRKAFSGVISDIDLRLMRVFKAVIECGGLSAAQTELGVGRSTISRQISDLETRLGLRLCHRGRSGFFLTQSGKQVLEYVEQFLKSTDDFTTNIASISDRLVGRIEIGMIDYTVSDVNNPLVEAIKHYRQAAPGVSVNLMVGTPNEVERGVIDGRLHLGIVPDYQRHPSLISDYLYDETVGLFCGGEHPIAEAIKQGTPFAEKDVCKHALVYRGYFESDLLRERKQRFPVGSTVYQTEAVMALVQSGVFLGFLPVHCTSAMRGENFEILPDVFQYTSAIKAIRRGDRSQSAILQDFLEVLKAQRTEMPAST